MKRYIYIIGILFFIISCRKKQDELLEKNKIDLISYIINTKGYALPPPPMDTIYRKMSQKVIDSILGINLNVAIYPILGKPNLNKEVNTGYLDEGFKNLIKEIPIIEASKIISVEEISKKSRHNVILADTIILKKSRDWKEYDLLFNFSNILFNENFDKAILIVGISRSSLWGSSKLMFFNKNRNGWEIEKSVELEIW